MKPYDPKQIEPKWQKIWDESGTYTADLGSSKPKYIAMSMFNYPSGAGIHIGHAMNYTISDVKARFKRQQGYESYHPVGWDSFGLPAENYAIKAGISPQESMATIIPSYHKQYKAMGWSNDWEKEIATHLPEYYKWTQWIFGQMHKHSLAYQDIRLQWWCTKCQTVLANEQVIDNKCWRHDAPDDAPVQKKAVKQWFFKITDYADELLQSIDGLDWTDSVKLAQKNWIGKSVGAEIDFGLDFGDSAVNARVGPDGKKAHITVFTTRADTLYGATYLVLAPEHIWVTLALGHKTVLQNNAEVERYVKQSQQKSELERQLAAKAKTGVRLEGVEAVNPVNGAKIPLFVADYVLAGYGTGAIMAVPAHDERDKEFAKKHHLPQQLVVIEDFGTPVKDEVEVTGAVVLGYNPKTNKYLGLRNKSGNAWLCGGGLNDDETYEECAQRELKEETGYQASELIQLGAPVYSHYYNEIKDSHRRSYAPHYLAIIDQEPKSTAREGHETFVAEWFDFDDLVREITKTGGGIEHWLEVLSRAKRYIEDGADAIDEAFTGEGIVINSGVYDHLPSNEVREKIVADLAKKGLALEKVNYKMRDWSVSRQRYWGAPIPIINCPKCGPVLVPDTDLPVVLPELDDFKPSGDGRSALARAKDWLKVDCPKCHGPAERETDTLDTYIDSSWYMYRYFDPHNQSAIFDQKLVKKWEPVDFYNGADHATAHLLYARFIGHFFKNLGLVNEPEPFKQFLFNGKVTAPDGEMFSKSKGNGVDPLEIIDSGYGADALRIYLMFAAPLDVWIKWDPQGVPGAYRFLGRLWGLVQEYNSAKPLQGDINNRAIMAATHRAIKKTTQDIEDNHYNTAIAALMTCANDLYKLKADGFGQHPAWQAALESLIACVAPFAPHISEELWHQLGHSTSVHLDTWPKWDNKYLVEDNVQIIIQVNGKLRATITLPVDTSQADIEKLAADQTGVKRHLEGKTIIKTIAVTGKLVNFVVK